MRFVTFATGQGARVGVVGPGAEVLPVAAPDLLVVIRSWDPGSPPPPAGAPVGSLESLRLMAPIPRPARNIFCVGKNYREHALEFSHSGYDQTSAGDRDPAGPTGQRPAAVVFTKPPSSVIGPDAAVEPHPAATSQIDYEAELAVIIGAGGRDIEPGDAPRHVWGYTIINDVTARDRQRDHQQWFLGKGLDGFCPMGPLAVTADELDPAGLARPAVEITCRVNGELRQKASTADLIFDIPTLIATISAGLTLEPGDIICTGTPAGVGIGFDPPRFLHTGDEVEIHVAGIGTLRNRVS
ncbi:MAG: fumarylacetoacetate hydrolase family protein [Acidimicrobiales bacterium]